MNVRSMLSKQVKCLGWSANRPSRLDDCAEVSNAVGVDSKSLMISALLGERETEGVKQSESGFSFLSVVF